MLQDVTAAPLAEAIETSHWEYYRYLAGVASGRVRDDAELGWVLTGIPHPMFNGIFHARLGVVGLDAVIEETLATFQALHLPLCWWTSPTTQPPDLPERLQAHGLSFAEELPGMAVDLQALDEALPPLPGLTIEPVTDRERLEEFVQVLALSFRLADHVRGAYLALEQVIGFDPDSPWRRYLGRLYGEPVAASGMFLGATVAGLDVVATVPEARRQGAGAAIALAPLQEARARGYRVGVLTATAMGINIYRRLGFLEYCPFVTYAWAEDERWCLDETAGYQHR
jgi:GNAT superfamily N-acetyltransferase